MCAKSICVQEVSELGYVQIKLNELFVGSFQLGKPKKDKPSHALTRSRTLPFIQW